MNSVVIALAAAILIAAGVFLARRNSNKKSTVAGAALPQVKMPPTPNGDLVDNARDAIVNALWTVLAGLEARRQESKDGGNMWAVLSGDILKYVTAVKSMPRSIPVTVIAVMNAVSVLEDCAENGARNQAEAAALNDMADHLARGTVRENAMLTEILGRKISEEEARHAQTYIDSFEWDSTRKAYVSIGESVTVN